jgi:hypothetical protein
MTYSALAESCLMRSLDPTTPVLPIGVSRHFRAAACVHSVTSPNKLTVNGLAKVRSRLRVNKHFKNEKTGTGPVGIIVQEKEIRPFAGRRPEVDSVRMQDTFHVTYRS